VVPTIEYIKDKTAFNALNVRMERQNSRVVMSSFDDCLKGISNCIKKAGDAGNFKTRWRMTKYLTIPVDSVSNKKVNDFIDLRSEILRNVLERFGYTIKIVKEESPVIIISWEI